MMSIALVGYLAAPGVGEVVVVAPPQAAAMMTVVARNTTSRDIRIGRPSSAAGSASATRLCV
jgi:hypothetical protein